MEEFSSLMRESLSSTTALSTATEVSEEEPLLSLEKGKGDHLRL